MEQLADVVIVSIFGRGNWLASELASRGWKVTLVDVSDRMGEWEPEDAEGPFGLLESADLFPTQKTRLIDEGEAYAAPEGLTFWLPNGPLECKSELTAFQLEKRTIPNLVESYLRRPGLPSKESEKERRVIAGWPFQESWFAHLAHQFASSVHIENHRALEHGWASPVFAPFLVRQVTRTGWAKGVKNCQSSGVKVRPNAGIRDVRFNGTLMDVVEVEDDRSGVERGRSFVWLLSSDETQRFTPAVHQALYPQGVIQPEWYWTRYQVALKGKVFKDQLPLWTAIIEDVFLPWTHTNLLVVRKRAEGPALDVWTRLPIGVRFDKAYLEGIKAEIERRIGERIPQSEPAVELMPAEYRLEPEKLGPPRFPVFAEKAWGRRTSVSSKNLFFDHPELWECLDWLGQFRHQNKVLIKLEKLKAAWDAEERKALQRLERQNSRSSSP